MSYFFTRMHGKTCLDSHSFIQAISFAENSFLEDFMKPFRNEFKWNDFFQFVIYFSLAPMPAIAYAAVNILTDAKNTINEVYLFIFLLYVYQ